MIVITRNGKTTVYTGWRAWLIMGVAFVASWLLFVLFAALFVGVAISVGVLMLLLVPALLVVGLIAGLMRR